MKKKKKNQTEAVVNSVIPKIHMFQQIFGRTDYNKTEDTVDSCRHPAERLRYPRSTDVSI